MSNYLLIQVGDNKEEDSSKVGEDNNKVDSKDGEDSNKVASKDGEDNKDNREDTMEVTVTASMVTREASATDGEEAITTISR